MDTNGRDDWTKVAGATDVEHQRLLQDHCRITEPGHVRERVLAAPSETTEEGGPGPPWHCTLVPE